ncbi:MAG: DNA starvation/stationary phase protection protein [Elusimicrobia bacterium]|nr:DNA starvation/stationary phase protection protein [Elusimicrobiota bacterium]
MKTQLGIADDAAKGVTHILNGNLSDEYVLYTKTRNFHWNVTGPYFGQLHKLFEEQYEALDEIIDRVAERARAVGAWPIATLAEFLETSEIKESPGERPDAQHMLAELAGDHEAIARRLRNDIATCSTKYRDEGTSNFLTELLALHEKMAWILRAHSAAKV